MREVRSRARYAGGPDHFLRWSVVFARARAFFLREPDFVARDHGSQAFGRVAEPRGSGLYVRDQARSLHGVPGAVSAATSRAARPEASQAGDAVLVIAPGDWGRGPSHQTTPKG